MRKLWELGFACMRAPASGAKVRKSIQPDLIAIRNDKVFVMEVKTRRNSRVVYIEREQVEKVREWARRAGSNSRAFIAVYFDRSLGWRFVPLEKLTVTEGGNYRVTREDAERGLELIHLKMLSEKNLRKIDSFSD